MPRQNLAAIAVLAVALAACSDRDDTDRGATTDPGATAEPVQTGGTLDPFATGVTWTFPDDVTYVEPFQPLPDLNGDGLADAVVGVCGDVCVSYVVDGPLRRAIVLPEDAAGTLPMGVGGVVYASDLTADGVTDLVVIGGDSYLVIEGPIGGAMTESTPLSGTLFDVNDDGLLDLASTGRDSQTFEPRLELRYGPMSRWAGEADVVLDPGCDDEVDPNDESYWPPSLFPDFTGDGAPELVFTVYGYADTCNWWYLTPPPPGVYDPDVDLDAESPINGFVVFPDQTGDGVADVAFSSGDRGWDLFAGPVTVMDDSASAGALVTADVPIGGLYEIPFDLNADGIGEFLWPAGFTTNVVYGGGEGLAAREADTGWRGYARDAWLEDGIVSMGIVSAGRLAIVDLGPGVPVDSWPYAPLLQ